MYGELRAAVEGDLLEDETMSSFLYRTAEKNNISFLVVDDMRGRVVTNVHDMGLLRTDIQEEPVRDGDALLNALQRASEKELASVLKIPPHLDVFYFMMGYKFEVD